MVKKEAANQLGEMKMLRGYGQGLYLGSGGVEREVGLASLKEESWG